MARSKKSDEAVAVNEDHGPSAPIMHEPVALAVGTLNAAPYNPRKISPEMMHALKVGIRKHGFVQSMVVQKKGLVIIGGHQRLKALKEICVEDSVAVPKVPCTVLDLTDREAKKLNVALNKVGGDFDARLLGELLVDINDDVAIHEDEAMEMGFDDEEVGKYLKLVEPPVLEPDDQESIPFARSVTLSIVFNDVPTRDAVQKLLEERSKVEKMTSGDIIFAALGGGKARKKRAG